MTGDVAPTLHDDVVLILTRQFHVAPESVDADLLSTGTLDSLALVDLILQLEARFGVSIALDELDLDAFRSASSIADFVAQLLHA